jgi:hypothetical protein
MRNSDLFEEMIEKKENECVVYGIRNNMTNNVSINLRKYHTIPLEFKKKSL